MLKDLQVLYRSMKASKFFRLCISNGADSALPPETLFDIVGEGEEATQDEVVRKYRDLLNYLFKLIVKLNNGAEQLEKQNEVYRLKLLNQDLRE
mgnify:CR=1 FL=1